MNSNSILQNEKRCWFCPCTYDLERHHIFAGVANRKLSEKYGLWVWLCHKHHTGTDGAQYNQEMNRQLKQDAQFAFERKHTRAEWMKIFGKNYL